MNYLNFKIIIDNRKPSKKIQGHGYFSAEKFLDPYRICPLIGSSLRSALNESCEAPSIRFSLAQTRSLVPFILLCCLALSEIPIT